MMSIANKLTVPATRGRMGDTDYYLANFPLGMVVKLFEYDPERMAGLPPEYRSQRALKKARIPEIADYVVGNDDYVFSSITVSVDSDGINFRESEMDKNVGLLELPMEASWIVNDGQHRVAGIAAALLRDPARGADNLSVVILPEVGLERSQQVFSDLNRTVLKTSRSLDILFDHREPLNQITNSVADRVPLFKGHTDKEKVSLSIRAADFTTLSALAAANTQLLADMDKAVTGRALREYEDTAIEFWEYATELVEPWADIALERVRPADARQDHLSSYALVLWAVANVGHAAISGGDDWKKKLQPLKAVDWKKNNKEWQGICMQDTEIITRTTTRKALAEHLKWKCGLGPKPARVV